MIDTTNMDAQKPVLCVMGPTGAGKSATALLLAENLNGVIINADSRQVYQDFSIITARPNAQDESRCPHELYGFLATEDKLSAGRWAALAAQRIQNAHAQGKMPILVGGTGLYMKALLEGIAEIPAIEPTISAALLKRCSHEGAPSLHEELSGIDPDYAAKIHPNDKQRIVRALEVFYGTGQTFSAWHKQTPPAPAWSVLRMGIGLSLAELEPILQLRVEAMLEQGALDEAQKALHVCPNINAPGWSGIGCAELAAHLQGRIDLTEAKRLWIANTRAYAKRQLTWFRGDVRIAWFAPKDEQAVLAHVRSAWGC